MENERERVKQKERKKKRFETNFRLFLLVGWLDGLFVSTAGAMLYFFNLLL